MNFSKIISIKSKGVKQTYDMAMKSPYNNYVANGVVVHNSSLAAQLMKNILPDSFRELSDLNAIMRPGPLDMGTADLYATRKHGMVDEEGKVWTKENIPICIRDILGDTYGLFLYQEQLMLIAERIGGFTKKETNRFRKLLIKYGKFSRENPEYIKNIKVYHDKFIENASKPEFLNDVLMAEDMWENMANFAAYGFNLCIYFKETVEEQTRGIITLEEVGRLVLSGEKVIIKSADENLNDIWVEVDDVYYNGAKELVEVIMEDDRIIRCTLDHQFRTEKGMLPLRDIIEQKLEIIEQKLEIIEQKLEIIE